MKHLFKFLVMLACVVAFAAGAVAEDRWAPPWDPAWPNQTMAAWDFSQMIWPGLTPEDPITYGPGFDLCPTECSNPYGPPLLEFLDPVTVEMIPGPTGVLIPTVHIDGDGTGEGFGRVKITIPNFPDPNMFKMIFWQMTSDKSATPTGDPPTTEPSGTALPAPYPQIQFPHPNDSWYTYNGLLRISPNPQSETITFTLAESTNIDQIVIKTVCTNVPEPSTFVLLGCGLAGGLLVVRRRRQ